MIPLSITGILNQNGRVAIVTGGGRGIGLETVQQFLDLDMTVVIGMQILENYSSNDHTV